MLFEGIRRKIKATPVGRMGGGAALKRNLRGYVFKNRGFCPICERRVVFRAQEDWFRDHYVCLECGSVPRERALMSVLRQFYPNWKSLAIHESSPVDRGASRRFRLECARYVPTQCFPGESSGSMVNGVRNENLEGLSFADESIDLHITQDVFEHVFDPRRAFMEVARTLKPGGAHLFTVPIVNKANPSRRRARLEGAEIVYLEEAVYHGNPISDKGSLVTVDWGFDIVRHIFAASGLFTHQFYIDDVSMGIRAEYIEVLMTVKPVKTALPSI